MFSNSSYLNGPTCFGIFILYEICDTKQASFYKYFSAQPRKVCIMLHTQYCKIPNQFQLTYRFFS